MSFQIPLDVLIIGGGIAGLWLLDDLRCKGYSALLVESKALGSGQTIAAQGILHGGLKHSLVGRPGTFVDALKEMPDVWRECLAGVREPDLRGVRLRSDHCVAWRTDSWGSVIGLIGARLAMHSILRPVARHDRPAPLQNGKKAVYRIEEQVVDPMSLLATFFLRNRDYVLHGKEIRFAMSAPGTIVKASVLSVDRSRLCELRPRHVVLTAGEGNAVLRESCGLTPETMRRLPLPILVVSGKLPDLNGFCLDGTHAKVIVTTQRVSEVHAVWQVATEHPMPDDTTAFEHVAMNQLREALPGFAWPLIEQSSYVSNRAEGVTNGNARPTDVHVTKEGNVITAWPTKLVLAPRLAERVMELLPTMDTLANPSHAFLDWPRPPVAPYPWGLY